MSLIQPEKPSGALPGPERPRQRQPAFPADMPGVERVAYLIVFEIARQMKDRSRYVAQEMTSGVVWVDGPIDTVEIVRALLDAAPPAPP